MRFMQVIEFRTDRIDDFFAAFDAVTPTTEGRVPHRAVVLKDRNATSTYLLTVEFATHELALQNSGRPEVAAFAGSLFAICDAEPTFRDLDVLREERL